MCFWEAKPFSLQESQFSSWERLSCSQGVCAELLEEELMPVNEQKLGKELVARALVLVLGTTGSTICHTWSP